MKKLLRNIALLLLPILLYYGVFLAFEPNNFFGLRATTPSGVIFGALREYELAPATSVILGDSRFAHMDTALIEEASGREWANLAFGGASVQEELDELDWLLEHYPEIDEVVLGLSFYTLNANYGQDRWQSIIEARENPFLYLTNLSFNMEALQNLGFALNGQVLGGGDTETQDPAEYEWHEYTFATNGGAGFTLTLRDKVGEHMQSFVSYMLNWELDEDALEALTESVEKYTEAGVRITIVLPPMHPALREMADVYGITQAVLPALDALQKTNATVLDYEFASAPDYAEDMYYDSLHLDYVRGLPVFTQMLFEEIA